MPAETAVATHDPSWDYMAALEWLYARQSLGIKLGLDKVRRLLAALGDPQDSFRSVHVAGTNGKGSVTRLLAETLRRSGLRVGCTTSPHLVSFTERIEVNGARIAQAEVARLLARIRHEVERLDDQGAHATFFEVVTALAFLHFKESRVAWAVVETGMGGRLDATNVLQPELTIITNVGLDHEKFLGATVGEIAVEKAGIMKSATPCITAATGDALRVLKAVSHAVQAPMSIVGEDYLIEDGPGLTILRPTGESHFDVGMQGEHQKENAAVVVAAVEALRRRGVLIMERALQDALRETRHAGRLESFSVPVTDGDASKGATSAAILLDGAHNLHAAQRLRDHLDATGWRDVDLVVGFLADKAWREMMALWAPSARRIWAVPLRNPRSLHAEEVGRWATAEGKTVTLCADASSALRAAVAAGARRIVVAGSLFLVGEARAYLTGQPLEDIRGTQ